MSTRNVELHEVTEASLHLESSTTQKDVSVTPTAIEEKANDNDHETLDQVTTNLVGRQGHVLL